MRILITGVAGHLGSRLAQWILNNVPGADIYGIDDLSGGYIENIPVGVAWGSMQLGHASKFSKWLDTKAFDYVFHLAAYAAEGRSPFIRCFNYQNNLLATAQVVNHCIEYGVKRLVFTSSMAVYGNSDRNPPFSESSPCVPIDPYGVAKLACEMDIRAAGMQHGLDYCIVRPHNVYGPYQCIWQDYRNVLGIWMRQYFEGKPVRIYGTGLQTRAFTYIDDILPCLWQAAVAPEASRETINLGSGKQYSIVETSGRLAKVIGETLRIDQTEPRHEVRHAYSTTDLSERILGFLDHTDIYTGLSKMLSWAEAAWETYPERRNRPDATHNEIQKGLYSFWQPQPEKNDGTLCLSGNPNKSADQ